MILFKVHFYLLEYLKSFQCMTWILEKSNAHLYTLNISMICEKYSHNSNVHPRFPQFMDMLETSLSFYNRNLMGLHLLCKHRLDKLICDPFKSFNLSGCNNDTPPTTNISWQQCWLEEYSFWNGIFSQEAIVHFLGGGGNLKVCTNLWGKKCLYH